MITYTAMCGMKLLIYSQTTTEQLMVFAILYVKTSSCLVYKDHKGD